MCVVSIVGVTTSVNCCRFSVACKHHKGKVLIFFVGLSRFMQHKIFTFIVCFLVLLVDNKLQALAGLTLCAI